MLTFKELCEKLESEEETILVEVLDLKSADIVDRCSDIIEDKFEYLEEEYRDGY
jgi:hypothetical protein